VLLKIDEDDGLALFSRDFELPALLYVVEVYVGDIGGGGGASSSGGGGGGSVLSTRDSLSFADCCRAW
jgi:hypothetical protein